MRARLAIVIGLIAAWPTASAFAQNLGLPGREVGALVTNASTRIGDHVDWGQAECGEPKYLSGTCVWTLGPDFSLTANALDRGPMAGLVISRWQRFDLPNASNRKVFDQTCRALVAALRPAWPATKVGKFTAALIGSARKDHEVKDGDVDFAFYTYRDTILCQAQPAT